MIAIGTRLARNTEVFMEGSRISSFDLPGTTPVTHPPIVVAYLDHIAPGHTGDERATGW